MQYATDIGQSVTEVAMNLAHYVFEDAEQLEMDGEVLTAESWYENMIDMYERHAYHAVDLMSPSEVDRLVAEYGIQKAIDLYCEDDSLQYITVNHMLVAILRRQLRDLITWTYYQMWKVNGDKVWKQEKEEESDDENDEATWFNTKYPNASCHRCEEKLNGHTVVYCGGHGGACETWYCASCHEDGTDDCDVCKSEEEDE